MNRSPWKMVVGLALALAGGAARGATFEEGMALRRASRIAEAEVVFAELVREHPEDPAALEQWATLLGWQQRFDDAVSAWKRALALKPGEARFIIGLSRVQYWKGELGPARERIEALLRAAPDDADAVALAGDICAAAGDLSCARQRYRSALALAPSAEIARKLARSADPPRFRFDAGGVVDSIDTRGVEGSFFAQASWKAAASLVLSGGYEQLHQFGAVDRRLNAGGTLQPVDGLLLGVRLAISPTADTVAPWEASGGAEVALPGPLTGLLVTRHLDFENQGVTIVGAGVRLDVGRWSVSGQGGLVHSTINPVEAFAAARAQLALGEDWHLHAGLARGVEAQVLLPAATATDVSAGAQWQIDRAWGLRFDYTLQVFGDAYVRNSLGSALTVKL
jgi:YaiO family outer membrane protein